MARLRSLRSRPPRELAPLAVLGALAALLWAGAEVVDEVVEGDVRDLDRSVLLAFRNPADSGDPLGPPWFESMVRDLTALGSSSVLLLVVASALGYFALARKWRTALFVFVSTTGGMLLSLGMKAAFGRPRPDLAVHGSIVLTDSFPSGHAMLSTITYLTLGAVIARSLAHWRFRVYVIALAMIVSVVVGTTRVYLGVHWPSDVLAGWVFGGAWALASGMTAYALQRRKRLEPDAQAGAGAT